MSKRITVSEAKQKLQAAGIDFSADFHVLRSDDVGLLLAMARATGYRKAKNAPGSRARMFFAYLARVK